MFERRRRAHRGALRQEVLREIEAYGLAAPALVDQCFSRALRVSIARLQRERARALLLVRRHSLCADRRAEDAPLARKRVQSLLAHPRRRRRPLRSRWALGQARNRLSHAERAPGAAEPHSAPLRRQARRLSGAQRALRSQGHPPQRHAQGLLWTVKLFTPSSDTIIIWRQVCRIK